MKIAVISLTEKGRRRSADIKKALTEFLVCRYCLYSHSDGDAADFDKLGDAVEKIWGGFDALIFVCACGIAVRSIAPLLRSKLTDPAVIVTDDCGNFVIPILSGHIGKANELSRILAERLGSQAVVTTATDIGGLFSPDSFAAANGLIVTDFEAAKRIAAAVLDGEKIGLISEYEMANVPHDTFCTESAEKCRCGIYIGQDINRRPFADTLILLPRNVTLGIGCRKGTSAEEISRTVTKALENAAVPQERICAAATIDIKRGEAGLRKFCDSLGVPLKFYTAEELAAAKGDFSSSEFVKNVTGVDNVCERSAVLHSGGALVMSKFAENGVTAAAAEKPIVPDFERKIL